MAVITISREFGSGGDVISEKVAQSLEYLLIDKSYIEKVLDQYGLVTFKNVYNSDQSIWNRFDQGKTEMISMLNQTIRAFARQDNSVIVGRGGFVVLKDFRNVLHVCIHAPFESRVDNIMQARSTNTREEAMALVTKNDHIRKSFLQTFYNIKHTEAEMFSLSIDTSLIPADIACRWILEAVELLKQKTIDAGSGTSSIDVNSVLASTVEEVTAKLRK
jgi:cytidylate kinase